MPGANTGLSDPATPRPQATTSWSEACYSMWPQDGRRELRGQGGLRMRFSIEGTHYEQETHEHGAVRGHSDRSWGRMEDVELHLTVVDTPASTS